MMSPSDSTGSPCPPFERLEEMLSGVLVPAEQEAVEEHVEVCAACQDRLARLAAGVGSIPEDRLRAADLAVCDSPTGTLVRDDVRPAEPSPSGVNLSREVPPVIPSYTVLERIGRGGVGVVHAARDRRLNRLVAIKWLLDSRYATPESLVRMRIEGEAIARMRHPGIVQVFELGEVEGRPFLVMEYVEGGTLASWLRAGGRLKPREAAAFLGRLVDAVASAHAVGVIHRDLKPSNILMAEGGNGLLQPKVIDFGLAKIVGTDLTLSGVLLGTPAYMAPEQAACRDKEVGTAADIWALGIILYELITGRVPFQADTPIEIIYQVVHAELRSPRSVDPSVPRDLELICLHCLEKRPSDRYPTAIALGDDLRRFVAGEPITIRPAGSMERAYKWSRRKPTAAALLAACLAVAVLLGAALAGGLLWRVEADARREADLAWDKVLEARDRTTEALLKVQASRDALAEERATLAAVKYGRTIGLAYQEVREANVAGALAHLQETRPESRGWEWNYVDRLCNGQRLTLRGHTGTVRSAAFSPDGDRVVTGGLDGSIRFWDARSGALLESIDGLDGKVLSAVYSVDGKLILGSCNGSLSSKSIILDSSTRMVRSTLDEGIPGINQAAFSRDGRRVATAMPDVIHIWDVETLKLVREIDGLKCGVLAIAFSPDGRWLATASSDSRARVWDVESGALVASLDRPHQGFATSVEFSPDGRLLVSAGGDGLARIWETRDWSLSATLSGHLEGVLDTAFNASGTQLVTASKDHTARVWDTATWNVARVLTGHRDEVWSASFSPDGRSIVTASADGTARVWDNPPGAKDLPMDATTSLSFACWRPTDDGRWDRRSGRFVVVSGSIARIRDPRDGRILREFRSELEEIVCAAFDPGGPRLVTGSREGFVRIWDLTTGEPRPRMVGHSGLIVAVEFSPGGERIVSASADGTARIWDAATGVELTKFPGVPGDRQKACWSPDGRRVLVLTADGIARVFDSASGKLLILLDQEGDFIFDGSFSPDGASIITGSGSGTARTWDATSGNLLKVLKGHTSLITSARFSPDGKRLVTASMDKTVRIWDAASGTELLGLKCRLSSLASAEFSPDGHRLLVMVMNSDALILDGGPRETPPDP